MFKSQNEITSTKRKMQQTARWKLYSQKPSVATKDLNLIEYQYYGLIDTENYSVVPDEIMMREIKSHAPESRNLVFNFVADAFEALQNHLSKAVLRGQIDQEGPFGNLKAFKAYTPPKNRYEKHISNILYKLNTTQIPKVTGINNITSYNDYVNCFFDIINKSEKDSAITLSKFNKSYYSSILDTGLAISYHDVPMNDKKQKFNKILTKSRFNYFRDICKNFGFSTVFDNPNILVFDVASPAAKKYLEAYSIFNIPSIFANYYIKTYIYDIEYINNYINLYYNKYVSMYPLTIETEVHCNKTFQKRITRQKIDLSYKIPIDIMIEKYVMIRNREEGSPFSEGKTKRIVKKAIYFQKSFDKTKALSYISREFKDQVWNKNFGYHDRLEKERQNNSFESAAFEPDTTPSSGGSGY